MKILSIGNSFSVDAFRYLHKIAAAENEEIKTAALYIPSCTIEKHYNNIKENNSDYLYLVNGEDETEWKEKVSIKDALTKDSWDYVTLQQGSHESFLFEKFEPYIIEIADFIKKYAPMAKIALHETWAYEDGSDALKNRTPFKSHEEMFKEVDKAYTKASKLINVPLIPSGKVIASAVRANIGRIHRDGFHCSLGIGRYLVAGTFYRFLTGRLPKIESFDCLDEKIPTEKLKIMLDCIEKAF